MQRLPVTNAINECVPLNFAIMRIILPFNRRLLFLTGLFQQYILVDIIENKGNTYDYRSSH